MREAKDPLYSSYIVNCMFNVFSSYTAIALNILTIHAMRKTSSLPKPLKTLLLSLAVSDLGVGLLVQPFHIAWMVNPTYFTVTSLHILAPLFVNASFFSVVAISVDRFLAIHLHLRYQEFVTHKRVVAVVISIWLLSTFFPLIIALRIPQDVVYVSDTVFAVIFGICFVCTTLVYCRIYFIARRHTNQIQALQVQQEELNGKMTNFMRQKKSAVSTFYVYLAFLVCCLPEYCASVAAKFLGPTSALNGLLLYLGSLMLFNSSLNPVVYCWKMRHIRLAIMDILRNILPHRTWTKLRYIDLTNLLCCLCIFMKGTFLQQIIHFA